MIRNSLLGLALLFTSTGFAVDLRQASDAELISELSARLRGNNGGGGSIDYPVLHLSCSAGGTLTAEITGPASGPNTKTVQTGSYANCTSQMDGFPSGSFEVTRTLVIAFCTAGGTLEKATVLNHGVFGSSSTVQAGSYANCDSQAKSINKGVK